MGAPSSYRQHPCNFPECGRYFFNISGLKQHTRTKHAHSFRRPQQGFVRIATPPGSPSRLVDLSSSPPQLHAELDSHADPDVHSNFNDPIIDPLPETHGQPFTELHPFINGIPIGHLVVQP